MIKELIHDPIILVGKSEIATKEDLPIGKDLDLFDMILHIVFDQSPLTTARVR